MRAVIADLIRDEAGATAIEYGFIALLIGLAIVSGVTALGTAVSSTFTNIKTSL